MATGVTIPVTGNIVAAPNMNLTNGQIALVADSPFGTVALNTILGATPTIDQAPTLAIYQGTAASADVAGATATYPLAVRPYERSAPIGRTSYITVTKQAVVAPVLASTLLSAVTAPVAATTYGVTVAFKGSDIDRQYSNELTAAVHAYYTTAASLSGVTSPTDLVLQNLVHELNRHSQLVRYSARYNANDPLLALGLGTSGTIISGLSAGSTLNVITVGGVTKSVVVTAPMLVALQAFATAGFTHVVTVNKLTAGGAATVTAIGVIGLDRIKAFIDYVPEVKRDVDFGVKSGWTVGQYTITKTTLPIEGQGSGVVLDLLYKATQGQRKYNLRNTEDPIVNYPSPVNTALNYVTYNITHAKLTPPDSYSTAYAPFRDIILIPSTETTVITAFDTALNSWLQSGDNQPIVTI